MLKTCTRCKLELPIDMFGKHSRNKSGYREYCKICKKKENKKYQESNKDKIKVRKNIYYENNKEHIKLKTINFQKANPDKVKIYSKRSKEILKLEIFNHYCSDDIKCNHCDEKEINVLTLDHIDGGGTKHKKEVKSIYSWIKRNNFPSGFQILCWNCQFKKRLIEIRPNDPTDLQIKKSNYVRSIKIECLNQYGGICSCGINDVDVLTLDHVNNDGAKHRKDTNTRGFNFYRMLKNNNFPSEIPLQVLCLSCQYRKIFNLKVI